MDETPLLEDTQATRVRLASACWPFLLWMAGMTGLILFWSHGDNTLNVLLCAETVILALFASIGCLFVAVPNMMLTTWVSVLGYGSFVLFGVSTANVWKGSVTISDHVGLGIYVLVLAVMSLGLAVHTLLCFYDSHCCSRSLHRCLQSCC